jgi:hypothetical protein
MSIMLLLLLFEPSIIFEYLSHVWLPHKVEEGNSSVSLKNCLDIWEMLMNNGKKVLGVG